MKKLNKILAITSAVMFMSCVVGVMPKAQVVYKTFKNETGEVKVPVRFEYPNGFTEDRLLSDIKEFNNHIVDKYRQLSAKTLYDLNIILDNTFLKTNHRTAEDLANYYDENSIDSFDLNMYYYRCFQNGQFGACRFMAGTTYCLLRNSGLTDCYVISIRSSNVVFLLASAIYTSLLGV